MLGFLRRHDLTTALSTVEARLTTVEAQAQTAVLRAEELHEQTARLIKRFDTRIQREKREADQDCGCDEESHDTTSERVNARRGARGRRIRAV